MKLTTDDLLRYAAAVLVDERDPAEIGAQAVQFVRDNPERTFDSLMNKLFSYGVHHATVHSDQ